MSLPCFPIPTIIETALADYREPRPVLLVTQEGAWRAAQSAGLPLDPVWRGTPTAATEEAFLTLTSEAQAALAHEQSPHSPVVYAVGGGLAADAGKYLAWRTDLPLVVLPTALTVDAHLTWASGVRRDGCVRYLPTGPATTLVADYALLAAAPAELRAAGVCDLLSIATGLWDWRRAEAVGRNPAGERYQPWAAAIAQTILDSTLTIAPSAGRGEQEGLRALLGLLALEVQLCNLLGHSRPEEGSEHYLAYALEHHPAIGSGHAHGDLVGPCILAIAERQGQEVAPLREALLAAGVPLAHVDQWALDETLVSLPVYVRTHTLPYGVAWEIA